MESINRVDTLASEESISDNTSSQKVTQETSDTAENLTALDYINQALDRLNNRDTHNNEKAQQPPASETDQPESVSEPEQTEVDTKPQTISSEEHETMKVSLQETQNELKETKDKYDALVNQAWLQFNQQGIYNTLLKQQTGKEALANPEQYWRHIRENPLNWELSLIERVKEANAQEATIDQQTKASQEESVAKAIKSFPVLDNDKGRYFLGLYARMLNDEAPPTESIDSVYGRAAQEVHDFVESLQKQAVENFRKQSTHKIDAFVEGQGNLVPEVDNEEAALKKARKEGDVQKMLSIHLDRLNRRF
ncbi:MAG: hypothetical protein KTR14_08110 [Vampirovibrio sp.]|nr:hypothetical protein [Vampirovibrio sp.]